MVRPDLGRHRHGALLYSGAEGDELVAEYSTGTKIVFVFFQVCLEICDHLKIELFRIPYPPKGGSAVGGTSSATTNGLSNGDAAGHNNSLRKSSRISKKNSR